MRTITAGRETVTESDEMIAVVWSWISHYDDLPSVAHQLTWIKDETWLYFETRNPEGKWISTPVRNERFQPSNLKQARAMAIEFIGGDE